MTADIAKVVRAGAAQGSGFRVFELLYINFVVSGVAVIFHPKHSRAKQVIVLHQFYKTDRMYFFPPADYFIRSMSVNVFYKVR